MDFTESVLMRVSLIPKGNVATYKGIATSLGDPNLSRAVGNALNSNLDPENVPCYRVVRSDGLVGGYRLGPSAKEKKLRADGIKIMKGRIIGLERYLFRFP